MLLRLIDVERHRCCGRFDGVQRTCSCACDHTHHGAKCAVAINTTSAHETADELFGAANTLIGSGPDVEGRLLLYREAADKFKHVASQYMLGHSYLHGHGVARDNDLAAYWFTLASGQGYARAQHSLGTLVRSRAAKA